MMFGMGTAFVWILMSLLALLTPIIALSAVWAIWRMTWAHEKIERHVANIERLLAERTGRATS